MTVGEFRAWLEGFEHSFGLVPGERDDAPSPQQWAVIKEKLGQLDAFGLSVSRPSTGVIVPSVWQPNTTIWTGAASYGPEH